MQLDKGLHGAVKPRPISSWSNLELRLVLLYLAEDCTEENLLASWVRGVVPLQPNHKHTILDRGWVRAMLTCTPTLHASTTHVLLYCCRVDMYRLQLLQNGYHHGSPMLVGSHGSRAQLLARRERKAITDYLITEKVIP